MLDVSLMCSVSLVVGLLCRPIFKRVIDRPFTNFDVIPLRKQFGLAMLQDMPLHITCPSFRVGTVSYFSLLDYFQTLTFTPTCHMPAF